MVMANLPAVANIVLCLPLWASGIQHHASGSVRATKPHNILFLMTDSMDGRVVDPSAPEADVVDLPFLRGFLAERGANFVRSYSNNPMCVPSRSSMMTGRRSDKIHVWGNNQGLAASPSGVLDDVCVKNFGQRSCQELADEQGYPQTIISTFKKLGYKVHMEGRLHIGGAMLNQQKHDDMVDGFPQCDAFDLERKGEVLRAADVRHALTVMRRVYVTDASDNATGDVNWGVTDWTAMGRCAAWINKLPRPEEATQPFFLHCSLNLPHYKYSTNSTWLQFVHDDKITVPTWAPDFPEKWHPYDSFMAIAKGVVGEWREEDIRRLRRIYYGMVAESDRMLSEVWEALTAKGYGLHNTYVIYVSDHGELAFEHRQVMKASMYEASVRVPLQIAGPGIAGGQRIEHIVSLLDVFPTLLDMAGQSESSSYDNLDGKSLLLAAGGHSQAPHGMRLERDRDDRDHIISLYNWVEAPTGIFMIRSGPWKLMTYGHTFKAYADYKPQLFNVEEDPQELHNVAAERPGVVVALEAKLKAEIDPDQVDKQVMKADFYRLQHRFSGENPGAFMSPETTAAMYRFIPYGDTYNLQKFKDWLHEAVDLFGIKN